MNKTDTEIRDALAAIALIMLARECGQALSLTEGVDMCLDTSAYCERFRRFVNEELPLNTEYGTQIVVPMRLLENLNTMFGVQFDASLRAYEANAVIERTA